MPILLQQAGGALRLLETRPHSGARPRVGLEHPRHLGMPWGASWMHDLGSTQLALIPPWAAAPRSLASSPHLPGAEVPSAADPPLASPSLHPFLWPPPPLCPRPFLFLLQAPPLRRLLVSPELSADPFPSLASAYPASRLPSPHPHPTLFEVLERSIY